MATGTTTQSSTNPVATPTAEPAMRLVWINAGSSCAGDLAGTRPDTARPDISPPDATDIESAPFLLVVEGSIRAGARAKTHGETREKTSRPTDAETSIAAWLDRLAPSAFAVLAVGTCAAYGGVHDPADATDLTDGATDAIGVPDYLGWEWRSTSGVPVVCVPGCPIQSDKLADTIRYLRRVASGAAPMIPVDGMLRPTWLFGTSTAYPERDLIMGGGDQPPVAPALSTADCPSKFGYLWSTWGRSPSGLVGPLPAVCR